MIPGTILDGRYRLDRELGRGGMGRVFAGHDLRIDRPVAIKLLSGGLRDVDSLKRFAQEARAAGSLDHPNVLAVFDVGSHEGTPYLVSQLLEGATLRSRLGVPLPEDEAVVLALQLADGLAAAHEKGIVHRDLKPENLFLTREGRLKILDFGIAKLMQSPRATTELPEAPTTPHTATGAIMGTIGYMSPEQVRGSPVDVRSDIFSAGVILYELLDGRGPFEGGAPVEVGYAVLRRTPPPPPGSAQVARIVERCLEKEPDKRYATGAELLAALRDLPAVRSPVRLRLLRRRLSFFAGLGLCAAIAGALYLKLRPTVMAPARDRIAVFPFVVRGGAQYAYLRDGLPDVLGPSLAEAGLKRVNPMALLAALRDSPQELEPEAAAVIARRFGAGLFISGEVVEVKDHLQLHAEVFDTAAPRASLAEARTEGEAAQLFSLAADVLAKLQPALRGQAGLSRPSPLTGPARASTKSLPALRAFVEGDDFLRRGKLTEAMSSFQAALTADPAFALAGYRLAMTVSASSAWTPEWAMGRRALRDAMTRQHQLPAHEQRLLEAFDAFWHGRGREAEKRYRDILRESPEDGESWFLLGETLFANAPQQGRSAGEAREPYQKALQFLGDDFVPAANRLFQIDASRHAALQDRSFLVADGPRLQKVLSQWNPVSLMLARFRGDLEEWTRTIETHKLFGTAARAAYLLGEPAEAIGFHDRLVESARLNTAKPSSVGAETPVMNAILNRYVALRRMGRPRQAAVDARELDGLGQMELVAWLDAWKTLSPPFTHLPAKLRELRAAQQPAEMRKNMIGDELQTRLQLYALQGLLSSLASDTEDAERAAAALWSFVDEDATSFPRDLALAIRAQIAWSSGDARRTLELLEQRSDGTPVVYRYFTASWAQDRHLRAQALQTLGRHAEALRWVDSILLDANHMAGEYGDGGFFPAALLLRAKILEAKGDRQAAAVAYAWFAKQWSKCEPELQPIVDDARAHLASLSPEAQK